MSQDWRNVKVLPTASILEAIEVIDREALRIALVVDEEQRLLGTITDGDIRRGLLKHIPLSSPVREVMNPNPHVADQSASRANLIELMEQYGILAIPLVKDGILVGMETYHIQSAQRKYDNPVFLMAGGFGTRLRPLTDNCPKPLLKVGDKPILETILESFIEAGFYKFYISTHYLPEMIWEYFGNGERWGVEIQYVHENDPLGTAGALGLLPDDMPKLPLIVMNGDVLTKVDFQELLKFHHEVEANATICVRQHEYQVPYGVISSEGNRITDMVEKPKHKFFVNAGIYVLNPEVIGAVCYGEVIDMPTHLSGFIEAGDHVSLFPLHEYWLDIGRMTDFEKAQSDYMRDFF